MKTSNIQIPCKSDTISGCIFTPDVFTEKHPPCVIICHGAFEYKENFFELASFLAENEISSVVIDMPGHGDSFGERYNINIELWVLAIQATIDYLERHPGIDRNRIGAFGFSSGGTAVLEAAITEPRIKALVTLDATVQNYLGLFDTITFKTLIFIGKIKRRVTGTDLRLKLLHVLKNAQVAFDPKVNQAVISDPKMIAAYSAFPLPGAAPTAFVDTIDRIDSISVPTLVMHGKNDQVDPPETATLLYESLKCKKSLSFLKNSGHCGHLDSQKIKMMQLTADTYPINRRCNGFFLDQQLFGNIPVL